MESRGTGCVATNRGLSHRAWCPQSRSGKTPVVLRNMVLPHQLGNAEDRIEQSNVSCLCDRAPVLPLSATMTASMGLADPDNYQYLNLREHVSLAVIIAAECFASPSLRSSREQPPLISTHSRIQRDGEDAYKDWMLIP